MSFESILNEEKHPEVLRLLAISGWKKAEQLQKQLDELLKLKAEQDQLKLEMEYQRTIFQKLIFSHGTESRNKDRPRRTKEDEQLLLHSQSLVPAPKEEEVQGLESQGIVHEMTMEEILKEARARELPEDITQWEEIRGLTEDSMEVTVVERKYILEKHRRKKYRYKPSQGTDHEIMVTAKGPEKLLPGCSYSIDFALSVVRDKYEYHIPLERQTRQMEALGLQKMGTKTLFNLGQAVATHMEPVVVLIQKGILLSKLCVHLDETPWPIFGKDDSGYLWVMSNQAGSLYRFEPTRSGEVAEEMLKGYSGPLMTDAYVGYDRQKKCEHRTLCHCWSHARRKFFEIRGLYPESEEILDLMKELFKIEHEAKTYEELGVLRREKSKPVTDKILTWLIERKTKQLPESAFTRAVDYLLKRWKQFTVFLTDVRVPLSNNEAERMVRHAVMGRKNFYGSKTINGADVAAVLYTVIESCKKVEIDPTTFMKQAILRNNHGQPQITPLQFAQELRKIAA
jgi:transposase